VNALDCHGIDSATGSFEAAAEIPADELIDVLLEYDEDGFDDRSVSPHELLPREVLRAFKTDAAAVSRAFDRMYCFHGTRVVDTESFRERGLLPLGAVVEEIWTTLRELAPECADDRWAAYRGSVESGGGQGGAHYSFKTGAPRYHGPYGELAREVIVNPRPSGTVDYLASPEIVVDIAAGARSEVGVDVLERFERATEPCIVKFEAPLWSGAVSTALWFLYEMLHKGEVRSRNSCGGFDGKGVAVPSNEIVDVEIIAS
jgi:hypothetical protein